MLRFKGINMKLKCPACKVVVFRDGRNHIVRKDLKEVKGVVSYCDYKDKRVVLKPIKEK